MALPDSGGTQLFLTTGCSIANTDPCPSDSGGFVAAIVDFDWADVLLSDDSPPTATGFGGALLARAACMAPRTSR